MQFLVFLFIFQIIQVVLPCLYWVFPDVLEKEGNGCCKSKKFGDDTYNFVETSTKTSFHKCESDCVYSKVTEPDSRYCFRLGGDQFPECSKSVTIDWHEQMVPVFKCVHPGTKVTFQWRDDLNTNVEFTEEKDFSFCNVSNETSEKSPFSFIPTKTEYIVSGFHDQCLDGMKAAIIVDKNCNCTQDHHATALGLNMVEYDLLKLWQDSLKDKNVNLTYSEELHQLYSLSLDVFSPHQINVMVESPPCSQIRIDCDVCFGLLIDVALGCTVDRNQKNEACAVRLYSVLKVCEDCLCQIRKQCDNSIVCQEINFRQKAVSQKQSNPCERDCAGSMPKKCVFNLILESMFSDAPGRMVDGLNRSVLTYNGIIPGPRIVICEGDEVVVNLENKLEEDTTLHFHGIREIKRPSGDGVPYVTQCPIKKNGNFSYGFTSTNFDGASPGAYTQAGTYWFHSHVGSQRTNGAYGALIIRPNKIDSRFDVDNPDNTIMLQEWYEGPENPTVKSILINGRGRFSSTSQTKYMTYSVESSKQVLFRVIGAISQNFPMYLSIEGHPFTAIATDSQNIDSVKNLTGIWIAAGERFDIVVNTNKEMEEDKAYKIRVFGYANPNQRTEKYCTIAWLTYTGKALSAAERTYFADCNSSDFQLPTSQDRTLNPVPNVYAEWNANRIQFPDWKITNRTGYVFVNDLRATRIKPGLAFYPENPLANMILNTEYFELQSTAFNMKRFKNPKVPFLLQNPANEMHRCGRRCQMTVKPTINATTASKEKYLNTTCVEITDTNICSKKICTCEHVIEQPYAPGYWSEVILINNNVSNIAHPIHQHGGWYWVLGMGKYNFDITIPYIKKEYEKKKLNRNFDFPPAKDTIQVPPGGYVILAVPLDNKGTWFFHCHINKHVLYGMAYVLQVGGFGMNKTLGQDWCTEPLEKDINKEC